MPTKTPPFFSICTPVTNRRETIFGTLASVAAQEFRDFEMIVVDCGSTDGSREEIERFFASDVYKDNPFPYTYQQREYVPRFAEDWNEPVILARGKYIAMLEGDDCFVPAYLQTAHGKLVQDPTIGLYATGNQNRKRGREGLIPAAELGTLIYGQTEVPPPSEAIFIRTDVQGKQFLYNTSDCHYAPETDLYIRIALAGYNGYYDGLQNTVRDVSPKNRTSWHYVRDRFFIVKEYAADFGKECSRALLKRSTDMAIQNSIISKSGSNFRDISSRLIREVGFWFYMRRLFAVVATGSRRKIERIFSKRSK